MKKLLLILFAGLLVMAGCNKKENEHPVDGDGYDRSYRQISMEEAEDMMRRNDNHIIVDVRTVEEYEEGHIPGAICIPVETIGKEKPEKLWDLDRIILIYCRSGNHSKQAAQKLLEIGYTNIYEFGGIIDWKGEIETGPEE